MNYLTLASVVALSAFSLSSSFADPSASTPAMPAEQDTYTDLLDSSQPHGLNLKAISDRQIAMRKKGIGDDISTIVELFRQGKKKISQLVAQKHALPAGAKNPMIDMQIAALKDVNVGLIAKIQAKLHLIPEKIALIPAAD